MGSGWPAGKMKRLADRRIRRAIIMLAAGGATIESMAEDIGVSRNTVYRLFRRRLELFAARQTKGGCQCR